jgi:hypothetical protein
MVLHCPADDGVVVWPVAPMHGNLATSYAWPMASRTCGNLESAHCSNYRQRPHASPSHMTPSCSRTSKNMEHSIMREHGSDEENLVITSCHGLGATFRSSIMVTTMGKLHAPQTQATSPNTSTSILNTQHVRNQTAFEGDSRDRPSLVILTRFHAKPSVTQPLSTPESLAVCLSHWLDG